MTGAAGSRSLLGMPTRTICPADLTAAVSDEAAAAAYAEVTLDSPRVRFNWGFHDATCDISRGRKARDVAGHFCRPYAAGYLAGLQAMAETSERPETSEPAWLAHVAGASST